MAISEEHIAHFLQKAREITDLYRQYVLPGDSTRKSADDLLDVCKDYKKIPINVFLVDMPPGPTHSSCILYRDHCDIYIRAGLRPEWNRFVRCKELFHLVMDKEDCRSLDIYEHLEAMNTPTLAGKEPNSVAWERLVELATMEFLFPFADREGILKRDPRPTFEEIATHYGIPLVFIEQYLSEPLMELLGAIRVDGKGEKDKGKS